MDGWITINVIQCMYIIIQSICCIIYSALLLDNYVLISEFLNRRAMVNPKANYLYVGRRRKGKIEKYSVSVKEAEKVEEKAVSTRLGSSDTYIHRGGLFMLIG